MQKQDQENHRSLHVQPETREGPAGNTRPHRDDIDAWAVGIIGLLPLFGLIYGLAIITVGSGQGVAGAPPSPGQKELMTLAPEDQKRLFFRSGNRGSQN